MKKWLSAINICWGCFSIAYAAPSVDEYITGVLKGVERNSSEAVEAIKLLASNHAKGISKTLEKEAILYLRSNYPYYYKDTVMMEKTIYYGNLLNRSYNDERGVLGWAALKSVKDVYCGREKISDNAIQNNLRKVERALNKIDHR